MVQGIQISYKRLDKEENFDGLKGVDIACGDPRQGRAVSLVSQPLSPVRGSGGGGWGESIGKQLSHQAGAVGGQEYTLNTMQTLATPATLEGRSTN